MSRASADEFYGQERKGKPVSSRQAVGKALFARSLGTLCNRSFRGVGGAWKDE